MNLISYLAGWLHDVYDNWNLHALFCARHGYYEFIKGYF